MNISGVEPKIVPSELPLEKVAGNSNISDADKAKEVARQFEAVLLRQILKSAHKTGVQGMFDDQSSTKDVYFDMMNFHLADTISKNGGLGFGSSFEAQLRNLIPSAKNGSSETDKP